MNTKLVESLSQIIQSLTPEEKKLLSTQLIPIVESPEHPVEETLTPEEWIESLKQWGESHRRDTLLLSDYAVSRQGIYEEN